MEATTLIITNDRVLILELSCGFKTGLLIERNISSEKKKIRLAESFNQPQPLLRKNTPSHMHMTGKEDNISQMKEQEDLGFRRA